MLIRLSLQIRPHRYWRGDLNEYLIINVYISYIPLAYLMNIIDDQCIL